MKNRSSLMILGLLSLMSLSDSAAAQQKSAAPTITVKATYEVKRDPNDPGGESAYTYFEWNTTNADYVIILGESEHYRPQGRIEKSGSKIFIAVGPGGTASQAVAADLKKKSGTGIGGVTYSFGTEFKPDVFFRNAYKESFTSHKSQDEFANIAVNILQKICHQSLCYTADSTKAVKQGPIVYTVDFLPNVDLPDQTDEERRNSTEVKRQIGFIVFAKDNLLYVLPVVKKNLPRDDRTLWTDDPDGLQLGRLAARKVAAAIIEAASR